VFDDTHRRKGKGKKKKKMKSRLDMPRFELLGSLAQAYAKNDELVVLRDKFKPCRSFPRDRSHG
jgi:hypothetical protein